MDTTTRSLIAIALLSSATIAQLTPPQTTTSLRIAAFDQRGHLVSLPASSLTTLNLTWSEVPKLQTGTQRWILANRPVGITCARNGIVQTQPGDYTVLTGTATLQSTSWAPSDAINCTYQW